MTRIDIPTPAGMTDEQRAVHDAIVAGRRGRAPVPLLVWLASPELAARAQRLGEFVRYDTTLPARLSELAILLIAAHWKAGYEWAAHEPEARKAGLHPEAIAAIADGRSPGFESDAERLVHDVVVSLQVTREVPDALYREAASTLGDRALVELVGIVGYYTFIAMTLKVFDVGAASA